MLEKNKDKNQYDVIVVGGGHAGCEAASVATKLGARVLLLTTSLDTIALIACSPSFGGPGRGHLLRELDIMGAIMPAAIDAAAIHFRHSGKEGFSRAPFVICDRNKYHQTVKRELELLDGLNIYQDTVHELNKENDLWSVSTGLGMKFAAKAVVIASGTFLRGRSLRGNYSQKAGRNNEISAEELTSSLGSLGFKLGTYKTGTGPTVKIQKELLKNFETQKADNEPVFCAHAPQKQAINQVNTYKTHTSEKTLETIKDICGESQKSPRYCPSLDDKARRFPKQKRHPVFIQPESLQENEFFLNGISMDFAEEKQQEIVGSIKGLDGAQIIRYGYSVKYSYLKSAQLNGYLESKKHKALFFAGQVLGSSGYEEAAASGLVSGVNAALLAKKVPMVRLERKTSYIGVLIDDLTSKITTEPYRMLLSRAANSYELRCDNADIRMAPIAYSIGLASKERFDAAKRKKKQIEDALSGKTTTMSKDVAREIQAMKQIRKFADKYEEIEELPIPPNTDFSKIGLSKEAEEKLIKLKPTSINEALGLDIPEKSVKALALYLKRSGK